MHWAARVPSIATVFLPPALGPLPLIFTLPPAALPHGSQEEHAPPATACLLRLPRGSHRIWQGTNLVPFSPAATEQQHSSQGLRRLTRGRGIPSQCQTLEHWGQVVPSLHWPGQRREHELELGGSFLPWRAVGRSGGDGASLKAGDDSRDRGRWQRLFCLEKAQLHPSSPGAGQLTHRPGE